MLSILLKNLILIVFIVVNMRITKKEVKGSDDKG